MNSHNLFAAIAVAALPSIAHSGLPATPLPEPETFTLLAVGAIALVVARWRGKN